MATIIGSAQSSEMPDQDKQVLARLGEIAIAQISTADDALADWETLFPKTSSSYAKHCPPDGHEE